MLGTGGRNSGGIGIACGIPFGYTTGMKISISLPDGTLKEADAAARKLKVSRSELMQTALREFLRHRREAKMAVSINRYVAKHGNELSAEDEAWLAHSRATVRRVLEELEARPRPRRKRKSVRARP